MKIEKQLKKIVIHHHLGMGDAIECNGMVRFFAEKYDIVDIFAKHNYYDATAFMYRDTDKIVVNKIDGGKEYQEVANFLKSYDGEVLIPGHVNYFNNLDFFKKMQYSPGRAFYHLADVPWKFRNEKFKIQRDPKEETRVLKKLNPSGESYIFVHDDPSRGFHVDVDTPFATVRNDPTESFFNMLGVLEAAEEVHCMSSSFLCLIDCLDDKVDIKKKFLHKKVRNVDLGVDGLLSDWEII